MVGNKTYIVYLCDVKYRGMAQTRNTVIAFLQIFGIWLVVIGHSFLGHPHHPVHTWIYSFHMPLFMFISGYLFFHTVDKNGGPISLKACGGILRRKARRLLIPYIVISTLVFFPKALLNRFALRPVEISWSAYVDMLVYPWHNVIILFWFLPTLFLIFCIVLTCVAFVAHLDVCLKDRGRRFFRWRAPVVLLGLVALNVYNPFQGVELLNIGDVIHYLVYFMAGYYFNKSGTGGKIIRSAYLIQGVLLTFGLSVAFLFFPPFGGKAVLSALNGILMSYLLACLYARYEWRFFHPYFGASYMVYLLSWFPQVAVEQIFMRLACPWWIGCVLAMVSGFYLPFMVYRWMMAHRTDRGGRILAFVTGHV